MKRKILSGLLTLVLVLSFSLVTVTPSLAASNDATLSSLTISSGTLTPAFASGTISYTDSVAYGVSSVTVTPTVSVSPATVTVNTVAVASGSASGAIALSVGANPITVVVTAADLTTTDTYTVTVTRAGPLPVALGQASTFAVLAGSAVTNSGNTIVTGDLGLSPAVATYITGFPPGILNGTQHADSTSAKAQTDLATAYNDAAGRTPVTTVTGDTLAGLNLLPGVYGGGALSLTGTLTLTGDANAVWIFIAASTLNTATGSQIVLSGGAQASNVFWAVGSSATLGATSIFKGNILASASITIYNGAALEGRALAQTGAVTLDTDTIVATPAIISFTPASGGSGTSVVITGTNLTGASAVAFGGTAAASPPIVNSSTQVTAVVAGGATGAISVTTPGGTAVSTGTFTFIAAPTVVSISPASGLTLGGTAVIITGTGFYAGGLSPAVSTVLFGSTAAASFKVNSDTSISAVTPVGSAGAVNVVVTTPGGNGTLTNGYTFVAPTFTLTAPTALALGTLGALVLGPNTGSSATPGSVATNVAGWSLSVSAPNTGHMTIISGGPIGALLADPIQVGMTGGTLTIPLYQGQLTSAAGYGAAVTFSIPLYASQTVLGTDAAGSYQIILTYTATPGF